MNSIPDYAKLKDWELQSVLRHIDKAKYPERYAALISEIEKRNTQKKQGRQETGQQYAQAISTGKTEGSSLVGEEIFSRTFRIWGTNFGTILALSLIVYVPMQIVIELIAPKLESVIILDNFRSLQLYNQILNIVRFLIGSVATLAILKLTLSNFERSERKASALALVQCGLMNWPRFMVASFLAGIKILLYFLMLIIPGIYKATRLAFIDCVVAGTTGNSQDNSVEETCDLSEQFVDGQWWRAFGFLLILAVLSTVFEFILALLLLDNLESVVVSLFLGVVTKTVQTLTIVATGVYFFLSQATRARAATTVEA